MHLLQSKSRFLLSALVAGSFAAQVPAFAQPAPKGPEPKQAPDGGDAPEAPEEAEPADAPEGPTPEELNRAREHFGKGKELFEAKDFEGAVVEFKESFKLSKNAVLLYNIGYTLDEMGDKKLAIFYYEKFLRDTNEDAANRDIVTARLAELKGDTSDDDGDDGLEAVTSFKHTVVEEAPPSTPLDIVAVVPEGVPWTVNLFYRPAGQATFEEVRMQQRYQELVARIPASKLSGTSVQYYIEVESTSGEVLDRSGQSTSPHIVYLEKGARPRFYADLDPSGITSTSDDANAGSFSSGGWTAPQSTTFNTIKWGTTSAAAALVLSSASFYFLSSDKADELEKQSLESQGGQCSVPPCRQFAQKQKDLQSLGQTYETVGTVTLALGVTAALGAGYLWYLDLTGADDKGSDDTLTTLPLVGEDFIGAGAAMRF